MIRILLSTRLGERRMTQSDLARVTGIRSQTINELYHDFAERVNLDDIDQLEIFGEREYIETSRPKSMPGEEVNRWLMWERQNMK